MAYRLSADEEIDTGLRRIFHEEITKVRAALDDERKTEEARIFKARKRLKRARSVVRLLKAPLGAKTQKRLAEALREIGRALSPARDADVLVATVGKLAEAAGEQHAPAFAALTDTLARRAHRVRTRTGADMEACRAALRAAEADAQRLPVRFAAESLLDTAFERVYGRGRAYQHIAVSTGQAEAFHDWRKYAKQRWHLSLLVREKRAEGFAEVIAHLSELGKILGADHDYAVLETVCRNRPALAGPVRHRRVVRDTIRAEQRGLRKRALALAEALYDDTTEEALTGFRTAYAVRRDAVADEPPALMISARTDAPADFVRQRIRAEHSGE